MPTELETSQNSSAHESEKSDKAAETEFDISQLPSLDSIVGDTDIRAFLVPGVPAALRQAALRRAWSADPKIRDFIEMAENQWDFNAPGVPGFDLSAPTGDLKRMLADIFGEKPAPESPEREVKEIADASDAAASPEPGVDSHRNVNESAAPHDAGEKDSPPQSEPEIQPVRQTVIAKHKTEEIAPKKNDAVQQEDENPPPRRSHGGAMPR